MSGSPKFALELTLTGEHITAERAFQLGLINRLVDPAKVLDEAVALAEAVAANGPLGVAVTKRLVKAAAVKPAATVWALQDQLQPSAATAWTPRKAQPPSSSVARLSGRAADKS